METTGDNRAPGWDGAVGRGWGCALSATHTGQAGERESKRAAACQGTRRQEITQYGKSPGLGPKAEQHAFPVPRQRMARTGRCRPSAHGVPTTHRVLWYHTLIILIWIRPMSRTSPLKL